MDPKILTRSLLKAFRRTKSHHLLTTAESLPTSNQLVEDVDFNITEENNEDTDGTDQPDDEGEREDHEDDSLMDAPYCGRQMKILYENGWHTDGIKYYNDHLQRYT